MKSIFIVQHPRKDFEDGNRIPKFETGHVKIHGKNVANHDSFTFYYSFEPHQPIKKQGISKSVVRMYKISMLKVF